MKNKSDAKEYMDIFNKRFIKNKQIDVSLAKKCIDIADFRTRIEMNIKVLDGWKLKELYERQINFELQGPDCEEKMEKLLFLRNIYKSVLKKIELPEQFKEKDKKLIENVEPFVLE